MSAGMVVDSCITSMYLRISFFTSEVHFMRSSGIQSEGPGKLNQSFGITVDKDGFVYVCDYNKFEPLILVKVFHSFMFSH